MGLQADFDYDAIVLGDIERDLDALETLAAKKMAVSPKSVELLETHRDRLDHLLKRLKQRLTRTG